MRPTADGAAKQALPRDPIATLLPGCDPTHLLVVCRIPKLKEAAMPIVAVFQSPSLTKERYEESVRQLTCGKSRMASPADWPVEGLLVQVAAVRSAQDSRPHSGMSPGVWGVLPPINRASSQCPRGRRL